LIGAAARAAITRRPCEFDYVIFRSRMRRPRSRPEFCA
jgi:hypothetical protein